MSVAVPTLDYQHRQVCGTLTVYEDGPWTHIVSSGREPIRWKTVVGRTVKWSLCGLGIAVLWLAAISAPGAATSWVIFAATAVGAFRLWRRWTDPKLRRDRSAVEFVVGPEGLSWFRPGFAEPWTFSAGSVATVKLHLSPPMFRRTHPVSVILLLRDGQQHILGQGTLEEGELIADAIERGLGVDGAPVEALPAGE